MSLLQSIIITMITKKMRNVSAVAMQKNMKATPCIDEKMDKWNSNKVHIDTIFEMEIQDEIDAFTVIADESIPPVGERI